MESNLIHSSSQLLLSLKALNDTELIVASRAILTLAKLRRAQNFITDIEVNDNCQFGALLKAQLPTVDRAGIWNLRHVSPEDAAELRHDRHQSFGYHNLLGVDYSGFATGHFPQLPMPLALQAIVRSDWPQRKAGSFVLWMPPEDHATRLQSTLERNFWMQSMRQLVVEQGYSLVVPSEKFLLESEAAKYAHVFECRTTSDFLFLLLQSTCVVGWESHWTHLAAAFSIPSLVVGLNQENSAAYEYNRTSFPIEYCRINSVQDWFPDHVVSQFSRLQSHFIPIH